MMLFMKIYTIVSIYSYFVYNIITFNMYNNNYDSVGRVVHDMNIVDTFYSEYFPKIRSFITL